MRLSIERLRWGLLIGGGSLLLLLAGLLGYSRYRAVRAWKNVLARSGATLTRETNGFSYSQSLGGRTVFTLHAAKAIQASNGKYALHDVSLLLYRQADGLPDRIYGSDFEYDEKSGVARALGEVHMDLQAPGTLTRRVDNGASEASEADQASEQPDETHEGESAPETVHVKTSGLIYVRKLGTAATDQDVEFRYGAVQCHAHGAEFDSGQSTVHLLADVQMSGDLRGRAMNLTAARADIDRNANVATLRRPEWRTAGGIARAADAVLHLTSGGLVQSAEASGDVYALRGTQSLRAARAGAQFSAESTLRDAKFSGGVSFVDTSKDQPMHGRAETVHAFFGEHGTPRTVVAEGEVSMQEVMAPSPTTGAAGLRREISGRRVEAHFAEADTRAKPLLQTVKIDGRALMAGESLVRVKTPGKTPKAGYEASIKPGGVARTQVSAEALLLTLLPLASGRPQPEKLTGSGGTALEQTLPGGSSRRSTGDQLALRFATALPRDDAHRAGPNREGDGASSATEVEYVLQQGHAALHSISVAVSRPAASKAVEKDGVGKTGEELMDATAERIEYTASNHRISLIEHAHLWNAGDDLTATRVDVDSNTEDAEAEGPVRATLVSETAGRTGRGSGTPAVVTHVAASRARFLRRADRVEFQGTDAEPVRLWQQGSQLDAATVLIDRAHSTLTARPERVGSFVRAVLSQSRPSVRKATRDPETAEESTATAVSAGEAGKAPLSPQLSSGGALRVTGSRLDYSGESREATFTGGVRTSGALGDARSQMAVVFLSPSGTAAQTKARPGAKDVVTQAPAAASLLGGAVEKVVLAGKVQLEQPGRSGTGDQLLYTAATSSFVLSGSPGHPPKITDAAQGSVVGTTLLFHTGDNSVVVTGAAANAPGTGGRVRTELNLHP